jgi:hypothetical protein
MLPDGRGHSDRAHALTTAQRPFMVADKEVAKCGCEFGEGGRPIDQHTRIMSIITPIALLNVPCSAALFTRAWPPAIAYSRVDTSRTLSAVPSSSNFPASHSGLASGLVAQSYRTFFNLRLSAICSIGSSGHCYDPD